jgi:hypothetical protein
MNDLTVVQTAQGLARYCLKHHDASLGKPCIVVGYDHRNNPNLQISSLSFAILSSLVFAEAGIDCLLLDGFVLTPLVPFVLRKVKAVAGIMVTASHNPKLDDGYKVYASDGCQIRAPMDKEISAEIMKNLDPWTDYSRIIGQGDFGGNYEEFGPLDRLFPNNPRKKTILSRSMSWFEQGGYDTRNDRCLLYIPSIEWTQDGTSREIGADVVHGDYATALCLHCHARGWISLCQTCL